MCRLAKRKERAADQKLEYNYGITGVQWGLILKSQGGKCKICSVNFDGNINVDHDHATQVVRGLLCQTVIPVLDDSRTTLF